MAYQLGNGQGYGLRSGVVVAVQIFCSVLGSPGASASVSRLEGIALGSQQYEITRATQKTYGTSWRNLMHRDESTANSLRGNLQSLAGYTAISTATILPDPTTKTSYSPTGLRGDIVHDSLSHLLSKTPYGSERSGSHSPDSDSFQQERQYAKGTGAESEPWRKGRPLIIDRRGCGQYTCRRPIQDYKPPRSQPKHRKKPRRRQYR